MPGLMYHSRPDMDMLTIAANFAEFWGAYLDLLRDPIQVSIWFHLEEHPICRGYWYLHDVQLEEQVVYAN